MKLQVGSLEAIVSKLIKNWDPGLRLRYAEDHQSWY